ncbi:hypothetical protein GCM10023347_19500 [Streptomyces chumphonensis]|uniref:hypothetical protein n=1 Tax=Streptomyces chumphonensis TaxID=1214925 RepID=UPI0031EA65E9
MSEAIQCWGIWEHPACGATGEDQWADDVWPSDSGHDCGQDGPVSWHADWECEACGLGGDDLFEDGTTAHTGHDCEDQGDDQDGVLNHEIEGAAA